AKDEDALSGASRTLGSFPIPDFASSNERRTNGFTPAREAARKPVSGTVERLSEGAAAPSASRMALANLVVARLLDSTYAGKRVSLGFWKWWLRKIPGILPCVYVRGSLAQFLRPSVASLC